MFGNWSPSWLYILYTLYVHHRRLKLTRHSQPVLPYVVLSIRSGFSKQLHTQAPLAVNHTRWYGGSDSPNQFPRHAVGVIAVSSPISFFAIISVHSFHITLSRRFEGNINPTVLNLLNYDSGQIKYSSNSSIYPFSRCPPICLLFHLNTRSGSVFINASIISKNLLGSKGQ